MMALVLLLLGPALRAQDAEIDAWIVQLGDDNPAARRAAQARLTRAGRIAVPALRQALSSPDAEVRGRAREILEQIAHEFLPLRTQPSAGLFRFSPDGSQLGLYPQAERLELQDVRTGRALWSTPTGFKELWLLQPVPAFSPDARQVYSLLASGGIGVFDASEGALVQEFVMKSQLDGPVERAGLRMTPSRDGRILYFSYRCRPGVYEPSEGKAGPLLASYAVADSNLALVLGVRESGGDGKTELLRFDPRTWKRTTVGLIETPAELRAMVAPRDLSRFYLISTREVWAYDLALDTSPTRRTVVEAGAEPRITCSAVSPDGGWLAVGVSDGTLRILRTPGLEPVARLTVAEKRSRRREDDGPLARRVGIPLHVDLTAHAELVAVQVEAELKLFRRR
jgi:hypothetical protein